MVCRFCWLESHPSPFLSGRKAHSQQLSSDTRLKRTWTSTLSAFSFQHCDRRTGAALSFLDPPHPTVQLQELRSTAHTTVPGACALELVPSPFGNHVINPFSVLVSYFFFKVYCLPKITSPRLGDRGETAADPDSADCKCQVSSLKGIEWLGKVLEKLHVVCCPLCWYAWPSTRRPRSFLGPSYTGVMTKTPSFLSEYDRTGQRSDQFIGSSKTKTKRNNVQSGL